MAKKQQKEIEQLLFQIYEKGVQMQDCNLTDYYEKLMKAINSKYSQLPLSKDGSLL